MTVENITPGDSSKFSAVREIVKLHFGGLGVRSLVYCYQVAPSLTFCCELEDQIVGVCFGFPSLADDEVAILECLAVLPSYTGRRIGTRLLTAFENAASKSGFTFAQLGTSKDVASKFYLQRGYEIGTVQQLPDTSYLTVFKKLKQ